MGSWTWPTATFEAGAVKAWPDAESTSSSPRHRSTTRPTPGSPSDARSTWACSRSACRSASTRVIWDLAFGGQATRRPGRGVVHHRLRRRPRRTGTRRLTTFATNFLPPPETAAAVPAAAPRPLSAAAPSAVPRSGASRSSRSGASRSGRRRAGPARSDRRARHHHGGSGHPGRTAYAPTTQHPASSRPSVTASGLDRPGPRLPGLDRGLRPRFRHPHQPAPSPPTTPSGSSGTAQDSRPAQRGRRLPASRPPATLATQTAVLRYRRTCRRRNL